MPYLLPFLSYSAGSKSVSVCPGYDDKNCKYVLNPDDAQQLQTDINNVLDWFNKNLLSFNVPRCKIVSFGRNVDKLHIYYINGNQIEREDIIRDLGVYFDSKLTFHAHINDKKNLQGL